MPDQVRHDGLTDFYTFDIHLTFGLWNLDLIY